jgi:hypothetical protein
MPKVIAPLLFRNFFSSLFPLLFAASDLDRLFAQPQQQKSMVYQHTPHKLSTSVEVPWVLQGPGDPTTHQWNDTIME